MEKEKKKENSSSPVGFSLPLLDSNGMCWSVTFLNCFNQKQKWPGSYIEENFHHCCTILTKGNREKSLFNSNSDQKDTRAAHHWGLWRSVLLYSRDALCFGGRLALQHIGLDHFEVPALRGHVAISEWDQDGASVLTGEPLLRLQRGIGAGGVRIQVVLEQIRLCACRGTQRRREHRKKRRRKRKSLDGVGWPLLPSVEPSWWWVHIFSHAICKTYRPTT